ncbi:hypothetical protein THOG11_100129 [Vibrio harveyi]|nr:hypothetical protein [Vibrio harveyi]EGQ8101243.1 ATPase [Vibrio parahaemolyticus]MCG9235122.1 ATPase [Vibrio harveyi]MCG9586997.1 ATPase [Vibrio harveyi]MCG9613272.1 ATPase [Vibrio harveyi]MCG9667958.1 ATPase [Vibrio harveyi]
MTDKNHIKEFADKHLQDEIHGYNKMKCNPSKALSALTGMSKNTVQQALAGKKNSKAQARIIELLEIIITNDKAKMKAIRDIANKKN